MTQTVDHSRLHKAYLIRAVEEQLLRLFSEGKVAGTTHTCIGQELSAVALAESLDRRRDYIFSNHRCHGHYVAWTDDVEGLIAEVMGKSSGVCGGIGGSQHLCGERFFSNGIQGGIVPVAAGIAFGQKLAAQGGIVAVCIGDGTLGEGVVYESFNIVSKWRLPLLIVLENNSYAQSTAQSETLAGDICARAAAFGIATFQANTWEHDALALQLHAAADLVRNSGVPAFVRVDTYRLGAHSKGDDDRDPAEIAQFRQRDPVNLYAGSVADSPALIAIANRISAAVAAANEAPVGTHVALEHKVPGLDEHAVIPDTGSQLDCINRELRGWLAEDPKLVLIGEDIRSPYGGAFKITRGLSDQFPDRVLNTPISEAAIVGVGNGLGLAGWRPVVEIMFGDFLGLCFDQLLNHAAKFHLMYQGKVTNPLIVRTPMGGGRGYGPTHSQNIEKHFLGIPGLTILVLHRRTRISRLYLQLRAARHPVLIVENKLLYRERCDSDLPTGFCLLENQADYPSSILRPESAADITVVALGRMSVLAEAAIATLASREEIFCELVMPMQISPLDLTSICTSVAATRKLLVVEEGTGGFDIASEIIASVTMVLSDQPRIAVRRIAAAQQCIPSAIALEQTVLPGEADIIAACLDLYDV